MSDVINMNTHLVVKNINGSGKAPYNNSKSKTAGSWLDVWRDATGSNRSTCAIFGCNGSLDDTITVGGYTKADGTVVKGYTKTSGIGGHVKIVDKRCSDDWYLAPICSCCNSSKNTGDMVLKKNVKLVKLTDKTTKKKASPGSSNVSSSKTTKPVTPKSKGAGKRVSPSSKPPQLLATVAPSKSPASKTVNVASYTKSNGTVVAAHTRSTPTKSTSSSKPPQLLATVAPCKPAVKKPAAPKTVSVASYTKSNGTVVAAHTRSTPTKSTTIRVSGYTTSRGTYVAPYFRSYSVSSAPRSNSGRWSGMVSGYQRSNGTYVAPYSRSYGGSSSSSRGTYVSGYTRSNGTQVSGYYRGGK